MAERIQPVKLPEGFERDLTLVSLFAPDLSSETPKSIVLQYARRYREICAAADDLRKTGVIIK